MSTKPARAATSTSFLDHLASCRVPVRYPDHRVQHPPPVRMPPVHVYVPCACLAGVGVLRKLNAHSRLHTVRYTLLRACTDRELIGAWNPML